MRWKPKGLGKGSLLQQKTLAPKSLKRLITSLALNLHDFMTFLHCYVPLCIMQALNYPVRWLRDPNTLQLRTTHANRQNIANESIVINMTMQHRAWTEY